MLKTAMKSCITRVYKKKYFHNPHLLTNVLMGSKSYFYSKSNDLPNNKINPRALANDSSSFKFSIIYSCSTKI